MARRHAKRRGSYHDDGVPGHGAGLKPCCSQVLRILKAWLNRRSPWRSDNGAGDTTRLAPFTIDRPRIVGRPQTRLAASRVSAGWRTRVYLTRPVRENRTPGSVRGRSGNWPSYRDDHPLSLVLAHLFAANLHYRRRVVPAVLAQADALVTLGTVHGFPYCVGYGTFFRGWALAMRGQHGEGLAATMGMGNRGGRPGFLVLLAEAAGHAGQVEEGLRLLAEVLAMIEANGREELLAETSRLQGEFLLRQAIPDVAQAEAYFYQALAISRRQQAKSWELRAALSLSRLWQRQGKRAEAYALLESVYGWFIEGFDTPDLLDAYALLMELS